MIEYGDGYLLEDSEELTDEMRARIMTPKYVKRAQKVLDRLHAVRDSLIDYTGQTAYSSLLKPCPFCGGEPYVQIHDLSYGVETRVVCRKCHVSTSHDYKGGRTTCLLNGEDIPELLAIEKAINTWNRRNDA